MTVENILRITDGSDNKGNYTQNLLIEENGEDELIIRVMTLEGELNAEFLIDQKDVEVMIDFLQAKLKRCHKLRVNNEFKHKS